MNPPTFNPAFKWMLFCVYIFIFDIYYVYAQSVESRAVKYFQENRYRIDSSLVEDIITFSGYSTPKPSTTYFSEECDGFREWDDKINSNGFTHVEQLNTSSHYTSKKVGFSKTKNFKKPRLFMSKNAYGMQVFNAMTYQNFQVVEIHLFNKRYSEVKEIWIVFDEDEVVRWTCFQWLVLD